jgi:hypothetical protein
MNLEQARAMALADKDKADSRVPSEKIVACITEFLNSENDTLNVENVYRISNPKKPLAQIYASFKKQIKEQGLTELVWPIKTADNVTLVKLTD